MSETFIIALDQGTTSSRAIAFNENAKLIYKSQYPFNQIFPKPGWVEHNPEEILSTQLIALNDVVANIIHDTGSKSSIASIGITNQRETTIIWNRHTGKPVYNAIVWQCRRTAEMCELLQKEGLDGYIRSSTGLLIDAYFSGTKIKWILDNVPGARQQAENGDLLFGTIDSWLIWNLTGGRSHMTDYSNASRTMIFNINHLEWDETLCKALDIPMSMLPQAVPNNTSYGVIDGKACGFPDLDGIPLCGSAGDQQSALFGQTCFEAGQIKNTFGTGCFSLMNTGSEIITSSHGLVTTIGWSLDKKVSYVLEGSVFNGGSTIQWLRDELGILSSSHQCDIFAAEVSDNGGVYIVPAFTGLGAPYWDMYARGTIIGLTRGSNKYHISRAALECIAYQVTDLITAMSADCTAVVKQLNVDGGASVSDLLLQIQADLLNIPINRPSEIETTALGAAFFSGLCSGVWSNTSELALLRQTDKTFTPQLSNEDRQSMLSGWHRAVARASGWIET